MFECVYIFAEDLPKFVSLKNSNPNVKLLTAIGGPNERSTTYSTMAASSELRSKFVEAIVEFLIRHKLDGMDFMWEYPNRSGGKPADKVCIFQFVGHSEHQMAEIEFVGKFCKHSANAAKQI